MVWNENKARTWLSTSWSGPALSTRMLTWLSSRTIDYFEPVALPERFASLEATAHECLREAIEASERFDGLTIVYGFSFREERVDGIHHVWCVDVDDRVVDASTKLYGLPVLYLGVVLQYEHVVRLARLNGLTLASLPQ